MFKRQKTKIKKMNLMKNTQAKIFYACIVILPILNFLIMWFGVNINSLLLAFRRYSFDESFAAKETVYIWVGFENIQRVLNDFGAAGSLGIALKNSLLHYIIPTLSGATLGLWGSYYMAKKMFGAEFFKSLGVAVGTISSFIMSLLWLHFCTNAYPDIMLKLFGLKVDGLMSNPSTITFAILLFPFVTLGTNLVYISIMSRIPMSLIEAARLEGIKPLQEFRYITFPLIAPTYFMYFITAIPSIFMGQGGLFNYFGEFADASVQTIGYVLFIKVIGSRASVAEYPYAAAAGMICSMICIPLTIGGRYLMKKLLPAVEY